MTTQAFEIQAVSDEELQAANGGRGGPVWFYEAAATDPKKSSWLADMLRRKGHHEEGAA